MSAPLPQDTELIEKHEGILGRRAELLEQMESLREQLKIQRRQQVEESEVARHRNSTLLQDLQKIEVRLKGRQLPRPNLLALEEKKNPVLILGDGIPSFPRRLIYLLTICIKFEDVQFPPV
ncbi:uncharacterized protein C3orf14 homolog isoform X3 [Pseudoliparis swirei]|uniref:uncharacterized protein C3orf14 homolog isoform X3 n=1 Tax=Pseudoliparis swirei TaxID=2059687 RepID=UPI0024BE0131|nr:uncharacterized protein C3orf14 homolog isoform X3 [Pseudoliparis swirei]